MMARINRSGEAPFLEVDDKELLILAAVVRHELPIGDRRTRKLRKAQIINDDGVCAELMPVLEGLKTASQRFFAAVLESSRGRQVEAWIGPQRTTVIRYDTDNIKVWGLEACEVPSALLPFLDIKPRSFIDLGPHELPGTVLDFITTGDLASLDQALRRAARNFERAKGAGAGVSTPVTLAFKEGTWAVSMLYLQQFDSSAWNVTDLVTTMSVPECLYELEGAQVENQLLTRLSPISSTALWARISPWFFSD